MKKICVILVSLSILLGEEARERESVPSTGPTDNEYSDTTRHTHRNRDSTAGKSVSFI